MRGDKKEFIFKLNILSSITNALLEMRGDWVTVFFQSQLIFPSECDGKSPRYCTASPVPQQKVVRLPCWRFQTITQPYKLLIYVLNRMCWSFNNG